MEVAVDMGFDFRLKGHIDGIVTDLLNNDYLWEHKAINHFSWQKYWDGAIPYDYVSQCCIYLRGLHADNPNIQRAILLLKNKNTAAYMEFIIFYNYDQDVAVIETATNSNGEIKEINETIPDAVNHALKNSLMSMNVSKTRHYQKEITSLVMTGIVIIALTERPVGKGIKKNLLNSRQIQCCRMKLKP